MAADALRIMCPNLACRKILGVPLSARGKTVKCRSCGTTIRIPDAPPARPEPAQHAADDDAHGEAIEAKQ